MNAYALYLPAAWGLAALGAGFAVAIGRRWRGRQGLVQWACAMLMLAAHLALIHFAMLTPAPLVDLRTPWFIALGHLILAAGLMLMLESLMQFDRRSLGRLALIPPVALALSQAAQVEDMGSRVMLAAVVEMAIFAACAACALRLSGVPLRVRRLFAGSFLLGLTSGALQIAMYLGSPGLRIPAWSLFYICCVGASVCLLLAHRERDEGEAQRFATLDAVTGLYNRRALVQLGQRELARSLRRQRPCSVMLVHVDHLKRINDDFGHDAGDQVLRDLAARLRETAHRHEISARLGSADFCMVLSDTPLDGAEHVAERVREAVQTQSGKVCASPYTVSIGIAERLPSELSFEHLVTRAELAQGRAREAGRNRVERDETDSASRASVRNSEDLD